MSSMTIVFRCVFIVCILSLFFFYNLLWGQFLSRPPPSPAPPGHRKIGNPNQRPAFGSPKLENHQIPNLPVQEPSPLSRIPAEPSPPKIWKKRQGEVKQAFLHAWTGYKQHAIPNDELKSVTGKYSSSFNGWGVSLYDALDTMWIMGFHDEFYASLEYVRAENFTLKEDKFAPFFETTIRYLGGLLSAYALSGEPVLLIRSDDLATALLPVFRGTSSGFPAFSVDTQTGETAMSWIGLNVFFAEVASCQMEYKYLAKLTGRKQYYEAVENVMSILYSANVPDGLFPLMWTSTGEPFDHHYSVGASGDSGYEYLLKQWLQSGDPRAFNQYLKSIRGIIDHMLYLSPSRSLLYVTDVHYEDSKYVPSHHLEHLSCFLPGLLALGAATIPSSHLPENERRRQLWAAEGLAYTCYRMYVDMKSGLGPESVKMIKGSAKWIARLEEWEKKQEGGRPPGLEEDGEKKAPDEWDYRLRDARYLLRPETVESFYILWRTTGDSKWRERGYDVFSAIDRVVKTSFGYASVEAVHHEQPRLLDEMPSYFLAETLKYLYLLFEEDASNLLPLDTWIFNTEAHPLPVFKWTEAEKSRFGIRW